MTPVEQTTFGHPDGNCFAACVASILERPLDAVPDFKGPDWFTQWHQWLAPLGLYFLQYSAAGDWSPPAGYAILTARSPRGDYDHAVVVNSWGAVVWDPHPERAMGIGERKYYTVLTAYDPARRAP